MGCGCFLSWQMFFSFFVSRWMGVSAKYEERIYGCDFCGERDASLPPSVKCQVSREGWNLRNLLVLGIPPLAGWGSSLLVTFVSVDIEAALPWRPRCPHQHYGSSPTLVAQRSASQCGSPFWGSDPEMHVPCYVYTSFVPGGNGLGTWVTNVLWKIYLLRRISPLLNFRWLDMVEMWQFSLLTSDCVVSWHRLVWFEAFVPAELT